MILTQGYRDAFSFAMIAAFLVISLAKLGQILSSGMMYSFETAALGLTILVLLGFTYVLTKTKLQVKIGTKKVSIMMTPFRFTRIKFKRNKITNLTFFKTDAITKSSGLLIHFGDQERVFNFGGNKGMTIELKNGRRYTFFSSHLYKQKEEIEGLLT